MRLRAAFAVAAGALAFAAPAHASGPPVLAASWSSAVQSDSARVSAEINPNGLSTVYHFEYVTDAVFQQNGFTGASKAPPVTDSNIGFGTNLETKTQQLAGLQPDTIYHYRVAAKNSGSSPSYVFGAAHTFRTLSVTGGTLLPDSRGWEMVSPVEKNGGLVDGPERIAGGGVLQAASNGEAVTYGSTTSFAGGGQGAAQASQYVARRTSTGWTTENITTPVVSGSYDTTDQGVPYQIFSEDLASSVLFNGDHCRGGGGESCGVANPPIAGTDAPATFQNYYLRTASPAGFEALVGGSDLGHSPISSAKFDIRLAGVSQNLAHIVLTTCAALTSDAVEVPAGEGCDPAKQNLYEWSAAGGLKLVNVLPAQSQGKPGALLGAQSAAISNDGSRVYWSDAESGSLYLREGAQTKAIDTGVFQTATPDGAIAYYLKGEHLYRYDAAAPSSTDLTPGGEVKGVLGASAAGNVVYYTTAAGISVWNGSTSLVAPGATDSVNYPPATGAARVTPNGQQLLLLSKASLTGYDNVDLNTGSPDFEVFRYDSPGGGLLSCVSCNPTNERPLGGSSVPGAVPNGSASDSTDIYKPRVISDDGKRVFFETRDSLASSDTNSGAPDVYEWEVNGSGSCTRPEGCVALISSGRSTGGATVVDASSDGSNLFFTTDASLVTVDPGSIDLYDARVGGGFPEPTPDIDCEGDACTPLPESPVDPTLTTLTPGRGNPAKHYFCLNCKKHHKKKHHKKKHHKRSAAEAKGGRR